MANSTIEPPAEFNLYTVGQFHGVILQCLLTAIYTCVIAALVYITYKRSENRKIVLVSINVIQWGFVFLRFVYSCYRLCKSFAMDSSQAIQTYYVNPPVADIIVLDTVTFITMSIADSMIVWRAWNMWNRSPFFLFPFALTGLTGLALFCYDLYLDLAAARLPPGPEKARVSSLDRTICRIGLPLSAGVSFVASMLIIARIYMLTRHQGIRKYRTIIEQIIQSALLYSVSLLLAEVSEALESAVYSSIMNAIINVTTGLAPALLVARIQFGSSNPDKTWAMPISAIWNGHDVLDQTDDGHDAGKPTRNSEAIPGLNTLPMDSPHGSEKRASRTTNHRISL